MHRSWFRICHVTPVDCFSTKSSTMLPLDKESFNMSSLQESASWISDFLIKNHFLFASLLTGNCDSVECSRHKHCVHDQNGLPHCVHCVSHCPAVSDARQFLCGADGVTYESTCHFRRATCLHGSSIGVAYSGRCRGEASLQPYCVICSWL